MRRSSASCLALTFIVLATGCNSQDPKAKMRRAIAEYTAGTELIATVRDRNSFEAAKSKLKTHCAWVREQNLENKRQLQQATAGNRQPNQKDVDAAMKQFDQMSKEPEFKQLMDVSMRYMGEVMRASLAVPEFNQFYQQETKS